MKNLHEGKGAIDGVAGAFFFGKGSATGRDTPGLVLCQLRDVVRSFVNVTDSHC